MTGVCSTEKVRDRDGPVDEPSAQRQREADQGDEKPAIQRKPCRRSQRRQTGLEIR